MTGIGAAMAGVSPRIGKGEALDSIDPKLRRAQSLVGYSPGKPEDNFYPTPPIAVEALLKVERFGGLVWEPACGDGRICDVLLNYGFEVLATDLVDRGYGEANHDFLTSPYSAPNIITNPPFSLAQEFIEQALAKTTRKVAILGKIAILEGIKRKTMYEKSPLKTVYVFSKRLTMTRNGEKMKNSGMIAFCWLVFDHHYKGKPTLAWL